MSLALKDLANLKEESWKYTSLDLLRDRKVDGNKTTYNIPRPLTEESIQYVFLNGHLLPSEIALQDGVTGGSINDSVVAAQSIKPSGIDLLTKLTLSSYKDGFVLAVPDDVVLAQPIEVMFVVSGETESHLRLSVKLGRDAMATLIERHHGDGAFTSTVRTDIFLAKGSHLQHYRLQDAPQEAIVLAISDIELEQNVKYESFACTTGARLSRHQVKVTLSAPASIVHLNGAHILSGDSHCDTSTLIDHAAPHCSSRETYKQVLNGRSRGVFQGKILVREQAQKTDGFQLNQALLLSPDAEVNGKPELEIYADDVKCSHGATVGQLDQNALFYLRSRGIPLAAAKTMLVEAFIGAALDLIEHEAVRDAFKSYATVRLTEDLA